MAEEREPPPLADAGHADFIEEEDGEDLFASAVTTIEQVGAFTRWLAAQTNS